MEQHSSLKIQRMSSIETEPRTLRFNQIDVAREAALYVIRTKTIEEAIAIFTEGLQPQPVLKIGNKEDCIHDEIWKLEQLAAEHHGLMKAKDIVSAPF